MTQPRNELDIHLSPIDEFISGYNREDRIQMVQDFSVLKRTGKQDETLLRDAARELYRGQRGMSSGFDASYMMFCGYAAYKSLALEGLAGPSMEEHDRAVMSRQIVEELAALPDASDDAVLSLQTRARILTGAPQPEDMPQP